MNNKGDSVTLFGDKLRAWRMRVGVSQATLERTIGRNRGWVNAQEKGVTKPPNKATCQQIAQALHLSCQLVWGAARAERLLGFDEDLWSWYEGGEITSPSDQASNGNDPERFITVEELEAMSRQLSDKIDAHFKDEESRTTQAFQDHVYNEKRNALVMQGRWAPPPLEKRKSDDSE